MGLTLETGEKTQLSINIDFTGCTEDQLVRWATADRVIALQAPMRKLSMAEVRKLNGSTIHATECGKKLISEKEKVDKYVMLGIPQEVAELAVKNPAIFLELLQGLKAKEAE